MPLFTQTSEEYFMLYMDGKALRELRCSHFLTQEQMAKIAGCCYQSISYIETDKRETKNIRNRIIRSIDNYAKCYEILKNCVSDIDYYDVEAAKAERAEAFEELKLNRRLESGR